MKLFFDTEFTGLHKNTTLISIGIVDEDGNSFYAEFTDYDKTQVDDWIRDNVISNLEYEEHDKINYNSEGNVRIKGTKDEIREGLKIWLSKYDTVEFVSDVCHYDFVLLIDIFGDAFDIPKNMVPACFDINQEIAKYYDITYQEAFDYRREDIVDGYIESAKERKHNSLYDAIIIKSIYDKIK